VAVAVAVAVAAIMYLEIFFISQKDTSKRFVKLRTQTIIVFPFNK
jgi:hypothetical protein